MAAVRAESMPPLRPTITWLNAAFADVVARSEDQRGVCACFFAFDLRVHLAGELIGVEINEVFFEGFSLRDYFSGGI